MSYLSVQGFHNEALYSDAIIATKVSWISNKEKVEGISLYSKFRYRQPDNNVTVRLLDNE